MFINNKFSNEPLVFINAKNLNYFMIDFFIRNGVDINKPYNNEYLLTVLIKNGGDSSYIKKLINYSNTNINIFDSENNHLIFLLLENQYYEILYNIIINRYNDFNINQKDKSNNPLLYLLIDYGFYELTSFLISKNCDVNAHCYDGDPIIFKLLKNRKYKGSSILIQSNRIDINNKNLYTKLSLIELTVSFNLYFYVKHILDYYNLLIPTKLVSQISLIEISAKNNNTLIMHKLIEYYCARKIQSLFRKYLVRKLL